MSGSSSPHSDRRQVHEELRWQTVVGWSVTCDLPRAAGSASRYLPACGAIDDACEAPARSDHCACRTSHYQGTCDGARTRSRRAPRRSGPHERRPGARKCAVAIRDARAQLLRRTGLAPLRRLDSSASCGWWSRCSGESLVSGRLLAPRRISYGGTSLTDTLWTTGAAAIIGLLGALAIGRLLAGFLVGTSAHDPLSLVVAVAITVCAGGIGCLLAAQGAARTSSAEALRN